MMTGILKISPKASKSCFVPKAAYDDSGVGNVTLISQTLVKMEHFVTDGNELFWRPCSSGNLFRVDKVKLGKACVTEVEKEQMENLSKCSVRVTFKIGNRSLDSRGV